MKIILSILFVLFLFGNGFSQLNNGNYTFKSADFTLSFTISSEGWDVSQIILLNNKTGQKEYGSGEWFRINKNGVDEDYSGPDGWYQFQTGKCNYSFDEPTSKLVLEQYDCVVNRREMTYTLTRAK
jgi:hypothetical protein